MNDWISVREVDPDDTRDVLVFCNGEVKIGFFFAGWIVEENESNDVTHWMELPEEPEC